MIPKIIHYCWFGGNPKPPLAQKCIKSWKKYCPDYQIIEWNEENYDLSSAPLYVRQAYEAKRWAFVTDYIRLHVVYENGGIYLDTDVELKKPLDPLLVHQAYFGFEDEKCINTGHGFGSVRGLPLLKDIMEDYEGVSFVKEDGSFDLEPCPSRNTRVFLRHGLLQNNTMQTLSEDVLILPRDYFCPIDFTTNVRKITENTYSIHWFGVSWQTEEEKKATEAWKREVRRENRMEKMVRFRNRIGAAILGESRYEKLKAAMKKCLHP